MEKTKKQLVKNIIYWVIFSILTILLIALLTFRIIYAKMEVIGVSMQPTFNTNLVEGQTEEYYSQCKNNDIVFCNKYNMGTNGDVIVLTNPTNKRIIKRIIATEGQVLELRYNPTTLHYNFILDGEILDESYVKDINDMNYSYYQRFNQLEGVVDSTLTIKENCVFVLGDNRSNSADSLSFGQVDIKRIEGKVDIVLKDGQKLTEYFWHSFIDLIKK